MNAKYEGLPLEQIKKDLDYVMKEFHPPKIYFRDEDFFQDINKAKAIIDYIIEKSINLSGKLLAGQHILCRAGWTTICLKKW